MSLQYYFWATHRRKALDRLQEEHKHLYRGVVLDIGGRDRGRFKKPKDKVEKWIFADIVKEHNPDLVLDVADMKGVKTGSIDVVNAIELFEHVERIHEGLDECVRVLKKGGTLIISCPFMYPVHGDPYDFQRWTEDKWRAELKTRGMKITTLQVVGRFFSVQADAWRNAIKSLPGGIRHIAYLLFPLIDLWTVLDSTRTVMNNATLARYHEGYFMVAKK